MSSKQLRKHFSNNSSKCLSIQKFLQKFTTLEQSGTTTLSQIPFPEPTCLLVSTKKDTWGQWVQVCAVALCYRKDSFKLSCCEAVLVHKHQHINRAIQLFAKYLTKKIKSKIFTLSQSNSGRTSQFFK